MNSKMTRYWHRKSQNGEPMLSVPYSTLQENLLTIMNFETIDDTVNSYGKLNEDNVKVNKTCHDLPKINDQGLAQGSQIIKTLAELVGENQSVDNLTNKKRVQVDRIESNSLNFNITDHPDVDFPATFCFTRTEDLTRNAQPSISTDRALSAIVDLISFEDENKLDASSNHGETSAEHNSLECVDIVDYASNAGCVNESGSASDSTCVSGIFDEGPTSQKWVTMEEFDPIFSYKSSVLREVGEECLPTSWNTDYFPGRDTDFLSFSGSLQSQSRRTNENIDRVIELNNIPTDSFGCGDNELKNTVESTLNNVTAFDCVNIATNIVSESEETDGEDPVLWSDEIVSHTLINDLKIGVAREVAPGSTVNNDADRSDGNWIASPFNDLSIEYENLRLIEMERHALTNKPNVVVVQETEYICFTNKNITSNNNNASSSGRVDAVPIVTSECEDVDREYAVLKLEEMKSAHGDSENDAESTPVGITFSSNNVSSEDEGRNFSEVESVAKESILNIITSASEYIDFDITESLFAESESDNDVFTTASITSEDIEFISDESESEVQSISSDGAHFCNCYHTTINDVLQSDDIYSGDFRNEIGADFVPETGCTSNELINRVGSMPNAVVSSSNCCAADTGNESGDTDITDTVPESRDVEINTSINEPDVNVAHESTSCEVAFPDSDIVTNITSKSTKVDQVEPHTLINESAVDATLNTKSTLGELNRSLHVEENKLAYQNDVTDTLQPASSSATSSCNVSPLQRQLFDMNDKENLSKLQVEPNSSVTNLAIVDRPTATRPPYVSITKYAKVTSFLPRPKMSPKSAFMESSPSNSSVIKSNKLGLSSFAKSSEFVKSPSKFFKSKVLPGFSKAKSFQIFQRKSL